MTKYTVLENGYIQRIDDDGKIWCIPNDPANSDFQKYLESLEK